MGKSSHSLDSVGVTKLMTREERLQMIREVAESIGVVRELRAGFDYREPRTCRTSAVVNRRIENFGAVMAEGDGWYDPGHRGYMRCIRLG